MLHTLHYSPGWRGQPLLRAMFRARKRVFVDLLKWAVPVEDGCYEVDPFDRPGAIYLVVTNERGAHCASARLLPTDRPHLLDTIFSHLCEAVAPRGTDVLEITRFCLDRQLDARARLHARNLLISAIVDHGLAHGVNAYTGVAETGWFQQILAFGWRCRALGLPASCGAMRLVALHIDLTVDTPALMATEGVYQPSCQAEEMRDVA